MELRRNGEGQWISGEGYEKRILLTDEILGSPGALVQEVRLRVGSSVRRHYHKSCTEVFCMRSGTGSMHINETRVDLHPGDVLMCQPLDVHDAENTGDEDWVYVVFKTNAIPDDLFWVD